MLPQPITFTGVLLHGHKEHAVQVPFDPAEQWGLPKVTLWKGRNGHRVAGRLNGQAFISVVVPRAKRFWLLVPDDLIGAGGVAEGEPLRIELAPAK